MKTLIVLLVAILFTILVGYYTTTLFPTKPIRALYAHDRRECVKMARYSEASFETCMKFKGWYNK